MSYARALLARDVRKEKEELEEDVRRKSLWGSIGRTVGGLAIGAVTGGLGITNPLLVGGLAGLGTALGGAAGSASQGKIREGDFFTSERKSFQDQLGVFGSENIMGGLKAGVTAGLGQALKLGKDAAKAKELGATPDQIKNIKKGSLSLGDFKADIKSKALGVEYTDKGWVDPNLQKTTESGKDIIAMDRRLDPSYKEMQLAIQNEAINTVPSISPRELRGLPDTSIIDTSKDFQTLPEIQITPQETLAQKIKGLFWDDPHSAEANLSPYEIWKRNRLQMYGAHFNPTFDPTTGERL